ncbi:magnesium and cobalt transport protein CorA [Kocuria sp. WRN011]|uniref:magnesium/cobalt transporter CorA n=1 Tax=Kocuria TaxID=57493 RepID=UPI000BAEE944|nr:magnesium/cobalt transporter CorA [Kocuria sp. WRN011]PBB09667.1 magnesium and cobalt transport protein CorA [Kocuria sp. WRN011]PZP26978.1 MAG: magnesium and cobalt transport protein CorA [Kocuria rhizophila]
MSIVDNAIYRNGQRIETPTNLQDTYRLLRQLDEECATTEDGQKESVLAWIGLYRPSAAEVKSLAEHFELHELAVEDTIQAHQRPKIERYGDTLFTVLRPAVYNDHDETVDIGEIHIFTGPNFVITIRHSESSGVTRVRKRVEGEDQLIKLGGDGVLYALFDQIVDDYFPVLDGLENDIDEIEDALFAGEHHVSQRIYELAREVNDFHRGVSPLTAVMNQYFAGFQKYGTDVELQHRLRDVLDHVIIVNNKLESMKSSLADAMTLDSTLTTARQNEAAMEQNEQMKRISSWAAILFAPSIVGSIYGMNFTHMPELEWQYGYPVALGLMLGVGVVLYVIFKAKKWL